MINPNIKPIEQFIKFINPCDRHGKLEIRISIYDQPVAITGNHSVFSTIVITEDDAKSFAMLMYEAILTEKEVKEAFTNIMADPMKFKN